MSGKRKMFLPFLSRPLSLSLPFAASSSAIPCVQLFPILSPCSSQHTRPCRNAALGCKRAAFNPGALGMGLGLLSSCTRQRASELRATLSLSSLGCCSRQAQSSTFSKFLSKDPLELFWALSRQDHVIQPPFSPLHLATPCHFSWTVAPYSILCYTGVLIDTGMTLYSKVFTVFRHYY